MKKIKTFLILIILTITIFTLTNPATAALNFKNVGTGITKTASSAGVPSSNLISIAVSVIKALLGLIGIVFFIFIIYGGFLWMTGARAGKEKEIGRAKSLIINAIIGLLIITTAYAVTSYVSKALEQTK